MAAMEEQGDDSTDAPHSSISTLNQLSLSTGGRGESSVEVSPFLHPQQPQS